MQARVFQGDGQAEPGASRGARTRRIGSPEAIEDMRDAVVGQSHSVVAHGDGSSRAILCHGDVDRLALAVLHGVVEEVAEDPIDAPGIAFDGAGVHESRHDDLAAAPLGERARGFSGPLHQGNQVDYLEVEDGSTRVVSRDLEQITEEVLESIELVLEQLGRPCRRRIQLAPALEEQVGGHADRRKRGAQLMRHVGNEALLHRGEFFEAVNLLLEACCHVVEGHGETREVVLSPHGHALAQVTLGELLRDARCRANGSDDLARDDRGHCPEEHDEEDAGADDGTAHQIEGACLVREREEVVELVGADIRHSERCAHDDAGRTATVEIADLGVGPRLSPCGHHGVAQFRRDACIRHEIGAALGGSTVDLASQ